MPIQTLSRRALLAGTAALLAPAARTQAADARFTDLNGCTLRFAGLLEAQALLGADDEWMRATSALQQRALMGHNDAVTPQAFRQWMTGAALEWTAPQRVRWLAALRTLAPRFNALRVPLPPHVALVASNGQDSAGAANTRGQFVSVPVADEASAHEDVFLMAHELWHIASRNAPALATRLYAELGFKPMPVLALPAAWAEIRLANPDAPDNRHAMRLIIDGRECLVTPVLVAGRTTLQPRENIFHLVEVRLLEVQSRGDRSEALLRDGRPLWHAVAAVPEYGQRLGGNTGYVIHPEETLADNVALLVTAGLGRPPRNMALLSRLQAVFESQPG